MAMSILTISQNQQDPMLGSHGNLDKVKVHFFWRRMYHQSTLNIENPKRVACKCRDLIFKTTIITGRYVYHPLMPESDDKDDPPAYLDFSVLERGSTALDSIKKPMLR